MLPPQTPQKTRNANHLIEVFVPGVFTQGNSSDETQARTPLEKEKYETRFHNAKTRLGEADVSFLIAKTAKHLYEHSREPKPQKALCCNTFTNDSCKKIPNDFDPEICHNKMSRLFV